LFGDVVTVELPDRAGTLDFSKRGLAEMASDSNDLVMVLDDTEKSDEGTLVKTLKTLVHFLVASGKRLEFDVAHLR
jgi:hypothetical protein